MYVSFSSMLSNASRMRLEMTLDQAEKDAAKLPY